MGQRPTEASSLVSDLLRQPLDPAYAEAACGRAQRGPRSGRRALGARACTMMTLVLIGWLFSAAYRQVVVEEPRASQARRDLVTDIRARQTETGVLQRRAKDLRDEVASWGERSGLDRRDMADFRSTSAIAGLAEVTGDGVAVTLVDARTQVEFATGELPEDNPGAIVDRDVQDIVNTLWSLGAEAIAVNNQRLTAVSTIRAAGEVILVDFRAITSPYQIVAIGPSHLAAEFEGSMMATIYRRYVKSYHLGFSVKERGGVTLPAASEPRLRYATTPSAPNAATSAPAD